VDIDILSNSIKSARLDADLEVFSIESESNTLTIEKGEFSGGQSRRDKYGVVRCIYKNKLSSVLTSLESLAELKESIDLAYKLAKVAGSNDCQKTFSRKRLLRTKNKISKKIYTSKTTDLLSKIFKARDNISSNPKVYSTNLSCSYGDTKISIANSHGISGECHGNDAAAECSVVAKDGEDQTTAESDAEALDPYSLDFDNLFTKASDIAIRMLGAKQAPTFRGELLIGAEAANLLISSFISAMDGEEVLKKRSFLCNKIGKTIASDNIKIYEKTFIKDSPHNRDFDDELTPTSSKSLIGEGKLKTYLHSIYSAEKMHEKPTGNYFLTNGIENIDTTNVVVSPGKLSEEDLLSKIKRGIYLIDTGDSPNASTGDLSATVMNGYYVENGKILYPVKETMVGINIIDLMKNITAMSSNLFGFDGIFAPALLVKDVQISGK
jgi:PmbA protein